MAASPESDAQAPSVRDELVAQYAAVSDEVSEGSYRTLPQIVIGSIVGVVVVAMIMFVSNRGQPAADTTARDPSPVPTSLAATAPAATQIVGGVTALLETFDELPINSALPPPWQIPARGSVKIFALPTSVDRSVRIASSEAGAAAALCRPTGIDATTRLQVAFDFVLGRAPGREVGLLTMRALGGGSMELLIGPTGAPVRVEGADIATSGPSPPPVPAGSPTAPARPDWQRLVVTVDRPAASVTWVSRDTSGAETGSGTATVGIARQAIESFCLHSPAGVAGWIAVDDLIVEG